MNFKRLLRHLWTPSRKVQRAFPKSVMKKIGSAIHESERQHRGEIRFAVEAVLEGRRLMRDLQPHERALEVFSKLRVWDILPRECQRLVECWR